jgi:Polyribonucleotide nucleotidyltransferase (polynucleotide phosphorylase)
VLERVRAVGTDRLAEVITITAKAERNHATDEATAAIIGDLAAGDFPDREKEIKAAVRSLTKELVRKRVVEEGKRMDGGASPISGR